MQNFDDVYDNEGHFPRFLGIGRLVSSDGHYRGVGVSRIATVEGKLPEFSLVALDTDEPMGACNVDSEGNIVRP
jgi:hypothetical protein